MISERQIELLTERLVNRIEKANTTFLKGIGSSIKKIRELTPTQAQQLIQTLKYGGNYDDIILEISKYTDLNIKDIDVIFSNYAKKDQLFNKKFYKYRNIPFIPFDENIALKTQTMALANMTKQAMYNFTRSNAIGYSINGEFYNLRSTYEKLLDEALLNVNQGKTTFDSAIKNTLNQIGGSGLRTLDYESGRQNRLDSMATMHLKSGLRELHNETQKLFGSEFGADGVEISVHDNPAPDHAMAQGRQFTIEEYEKLQAGLEAKDYYGETVMLEHSGKGGYRPISDYNCYHYIFSVVLGVSEPEYNQEQLEEIIVNNDKGFELDGKHYTNYEGEQMQRTFERKIREQKDIQILAKACDNQELISESQTKITLLTNKYKELSEKSGLPTKMERLRVSGYRRTKVNKEDIIKNNDIKKNYKVLNNKEISGFDKKTKLLKKNLSQEEINSISSYVGISHKEINETLWKGKPSEKIIYNNVNEINKDIKNIDSAMNKSIIDRNLTTFRGTYEDFSNYKIGDNILMKNFVSTSLNERFAIQRAKNKGNGGIVLEIKTPKNTKGIYIGDNFGDQNEKELLLNRNMTYKLIDIKNIKDNNYGDYKKYILEILKKRIK